MSTRDCCVIFREEAERPRLVSVMVGPMTAVEAYVAELNARAVKIREAFFKSDLRKAVDKAIREVQAAGELSLAAAMDRRDAIEYDIAQKFADPEMLALDPGWTFDRYDDESGYYFIRNVPLMETP